MIILPAKPFPLMKLSKENRTLIMRFLLSPQGILDGKVSIVSDGSARGGFNAKGYTDGIQNRLAILLVNREVSLPTQDPDQSTDLL